jgi:glycosyltransferase involved in cell wall biosynthesis
MKFSVIIPTYNGAKYIEETLQSISAQTFRAYETIVVDDGSIDGTPDLVHALAPKARLIQQSRTGVCGARNAGANAANGDFLAFLDQDDVWYPWALAEYAALFEQYPNAVAVGGKAALFFDSKTPDMKRLPQRTVHLFDSCRLCLESSFALPSTLAVKTHAFKECGKFQDRAIKEGGCSEEWDLCFRLSKLGSLVQTSEFVTAYRIHSANTSKTLQYNATLRYTINFESITGYWLSKCQEIGLNDRRFIRSMLANRYMIRHFDLCDQQQFWRSLPWLIRSMVIWPWKLDSLRYSTSFFRLKRLLVFPKLILRRPED